MQDRTHRHDLIVVGAGSAGYAAARTARDVGCDVALVDTGPLGGLCILRGCMPSKTLIASSDALQDARDASGLGIGAEALSIDMPFIAARKRELVKGFAEYRIEGIERFPLYRGAARFLSPTRVGRRRRDRVWSRRGSSSRPAASFRRACFPGWRPPASSTATPCSKLERIPASVVVLGGGYTACELGQFLARMGARTTMLIRSGHLLTASDDDVGDALTEYFREEGIDVVTRSRPPRRAATRRRESRALPARRRGARGRGRGDLLRAGPLAERRGPRSRQARASRSMPTADRGRRRDAHQQPERLTRSATLPASTCWCTSRSTRARLRRATPASTRARSPTTAWPARTRSSPIRSSRRWERARRSCARTASPYVVRALRLCRARQGAVPEQRPRAS